MGDSQINELASEIQRVIKERNEFVCKALEEIFSILRSYSEDLSGFIKSSQDELNSRIQSIFADVERLNERRQCIIDGMEGINNEIISLIREDKASACEDGNLSDPETIGSEGPTRV